MHEVQHAATGDLLGRQAEQPLGRSVAPAELTERTDDDDRVRQGGGDVPETVRGAHRDRNVFRHTRRIDPPVGAIDPKFSAPTRDVTDHPRHSGRDCPICRH